MLAGVILIDFNPGGADLQLATARHSVAGVHGEIHDDLLEHAGISVNAGRLGTVIRHQGDVLAEQPLQHVGKVLQDKVEVQDLGLDYLFTAEHEQLPG